VRRPQAAISATVAVVRVTRTERGKGHGLQAGFRHRPVRGSGTGS
jgi:hypothetical protein